MFLTNADIVELSEWRRGLHRMPELSGEEVNTAREVVRFLTATGADRIVTELGGHGVAAIYEGAEPGPTLMFRAELDALPIEEVVGHPPPLAAPPARRICAAMTGIWRSSQASRGASDGSDRQRGRAVLMFQPAEEDGSGAAAVVADPKFNELAPDFAFAVHNMPGMPLGKAALTTGVVSCASRGMRIVLSGKTAHASMPEFGVSPMPAMAALMPALTALGGGGPLDEGFAMLTVTHASLGEPAFGVAPGRGEIWTTLRTLTDSRMADLRERAETLVRRIAAENGLGLDITYHDVFPHCESAPEPVAHLRRALEAEEIPFDRGLLPMRASEDFGHFSARAPVGVLSARRGRTSPEPAQPRLRLPGRSHRHRRAGVHADFAEQSRIGSGSGRQAGIA